MIRAGMLAYEAEESLLLFWEPENPVLNAFLIATVTTLLAYNVIAITFDLVLGFKPRRQARISELYAEHLAQNLSPFAVLSDFIRKDALTRRRFSLPAGTALKRTGNRVRLRKVLKISLLLVIAPIVNIVSITLALERDTFFSFSAAKFGGVALGVTKNPDLLSFDPLTENCQLSRFDLKRGETLSSDISVCEVFGELKRPETANRASIFIVRAGNHLLGFALNMNGKSVHIGKLAFLRTERSGVQESFHVNLKVEEETLNYLANIAVEKLAKECGVDPASAQDILPLDLYPGTRTEVLKAMTMACNRDPTRLTSVAKSLSRYVTLVESDSMMVYTIEGNGRTTTSDLEDLNLLDGGDFPLFIRRRRNLSLLLIAALASIGIAVRFLTRVFAHNDVEMGNEIIMKKAFGLQFCDSGLSEHGLVIDYTWRNGPGCLEFLKDGICCTKSYLCKD